MVGCYGFPSHTPQGVFSPFTRKTARLRFHEFSLSLRSAAAGSIQSPRPGAIENKQGQARNADAAPVSAYNITEPRSPQRRGGRGCGFTCGAFSLPNCHSSIVNSQSGKTKSCPCGQDEIHAAHGRNPAGGWTKSARVARRRKSPQNFRSAGFVYPGSYLLPEPASAGAGRGGAAQQRRRVAGRYAGLAYLRPIEWLVALDCSSGERMRFTPTRQGRVRYSEPAPAGGSL